MIYSISVFNLFQTVLNGFCKNLLVLGVLLLLSQEKKKYCDKICGWRQLPEFTSTLLKKMNGTTGASL